MSGALPPDPPPLSDPHPVRERKGPLSWMARNIVAANLIMAVLLVGGALSMFSIRQEVIPEFELDMVRVNLIYPGASPEEVEKSVTVAVEEAVRGVDGIKQLSSYSGEGGASVLVELLVGTPPDRALSDIKAAVDRITSFPADLERPIVSLVAIRVSVLSVVLYGDVSERTLHALGERMRDELLQDPRITTVDLGGVRPLEISVEVPQQSLRAHGLTLEQIAQAIRSASVEVPAGGVKTEGGEILLRTTERRDYGPEFEDIAVLSRPDGTEVRLRDIARVRDGFQETDVEADFNGKRAMMVRVYRIGEETPLSVSAAVHEYIEKARPDLPPGVELAVWGDRAEMYGERIGLLQRNALIGLALVLLLLGLFLEPRLSFWVTIGIPVSFLGALLFLPAADVSINMISLFAFIVTLGIVVDDAIVVGEAVYKRRRDGLPFVKAAITGVHDVAQPVIFSVLTTVVAFSPLLFVPGVRGKFFRQIPVVVIAVLLLSLVESLLVLPAHLAHSKRQPDRGLLGWLYRGQQRFSSAFERFIHGRFVPMLRGVVRQRYLALAVGVALLLSSCGLVAGGRVDFVFWHKMELDVVFAQLEMPYGTPLSETAAHKERMVEAAREVLAEAGGEERVSRGIYGQLGAASYGGLGHAAASGTHVAEVSVFLVPVDQRELSTAEFARRWRERIGEIPGADRLEFDYESGSSGAPISIELSHQDMTALRRAASRLADELGEFTGVIDIDDGFALGKEQLNFRLKPEARSLGVTETDLARQVRAAFFGVEAARQQRGRNEVRTYVRLPRSERSSLGDVERLLIRTRDGGEVPLGVAATVERGHSYTEIARKNGRRVVEVTADVIEGAANANKVVAELEREALPELLAAFPGLSYELGGEQRSQQESMDYLLRGFGLALLVMFALMAIPFRSYAQPLIIMSAIPFGIIGAIVGHIIMGYDLSLLSAMGFVALSGVVVNDSLVLIAAINEFRRQGMSSLDAVVAGAARRFRPILLTSLTTFFGLAPMIFETSMQARFLIPMALSLGFGVLFATVIILLLVPSLYLTLEDMRALFRRLWGSQQEAALS